MKSTLLKTLAAASLVATTHAEIHVMGASWKERGVDAPLGTIIPNPGTVAAPRGYLIMDQTALTTTPTPATYIEYGEIRNAGVITRYYTVDTDFTAFLADAVFGDSGGRRLYGRMHVPVSITNVANPMSTFTGSTFASGFPKKMSFDQTVFQTGASDGRTGPQIVMAGAATLRSVISGSANPVEVTATTISGAATELLARLDKQGYTQILGEAPQITSTFPATVSLQDGATQTLTVTLDPDVFPGTGDTFQGPTYQWFKNNVAIPTGVGASFTITGGASSATNGAGTYKVVVTNGLGSATSTDVVVSSVANTFTTNLPGTLTIEGASTSVLSVVITPTSVTPPTYQWFKAPTATPTAFAPIAAADGGQGTTLAVTGGAAATGAGVYKVEITNSAGVLTSGSCVVTVNNVPMSFTTNLPASLVVSFSGTATLTPVINANALPAVAKYQWQKAPTGTTNFVDIAVGNGGNGSTFTVSGNNANTNGPGVYRVIVSNAATPTPATITSVSCNVTAGP
jgi:hypothetical protein